jgi:anaphase-promoting complex subunit 1
LGRAKAEYYGRVVVAGYLACLAMTDVYRYLSHEHDPTVVGVLLGMSAAKR